MIGCSPSLDNPEMMAERNRYWEESVDPERKKVFEEYMARTPDEAIESGPKFKRFLAWLAGHGYATPVIQKRDPKVAA